MLEAQKHKRAFASLGDLASKTGRKAYELARPFVIGFMKK